VLRVRAAGERDLVLLPSFPSHGWVRADLNVRAAGERDLAFPIGMIFSIEIGGAV
jgi:hypothetical protein